MKFIGIEIPYARTVFATLFWLSLGLTLLWILAGKYEKAFDEFYLMMLFSILHENTKPAMIDKD